MRSRKTIPIAAALLAGLFGQGAGHAEMPAKDGEAIAVEIVNIEGAFRLMRGGEVYDVKGVGLEFGSIEALIAHGGNSFRTWRTDNGIETGQQVLDRAAALGATVAM